MHYSVSMLKKSKSVMVRVKNSSPELMKYLASLEKGSPSDDLFCKCVRWDEGKWRVCLDGRKTRYLFIDQLPPEMRTRITLLSMVNDGDMVEGVGQRVLENLLYVNVPRAEYQELASIRKNQ